MIEDKETAYELIEAFLHAKDNYNYINLSQDNLYLGWVSNFNIKFKDGKPMFLDLRNENDLFLLFALSIAWSRTGRWENAAYFVTYLKLTKKDFMEYWLDEANLEIEQINRKESVQLILKEVSGLTSRIKVSFRHDTFKSLNILAKNWVDINMQLNNANLSNNYIGFMLYMRGIKGLGVGDKSMMIKIPLILRELRCQNIFNNIPGELCCVPDERVKKACKDLGIPLKSNINTNITNLIKASSKIYELFGDLYDLPLFAYDDIKKNIIPHR